MSYSIMSVRSGSTKYLPLVLAALIVPALLQPCEKGDQDSSNELDFYSLFAMDIENDIIIMEKYRGKVSLVVNVASQCGYTEGHYKGLNYLQEAFKDTDKFTVLGFPCNQFGEQEPGTNEEIYSFVRNKMGSNFPMFAKINVLERDVPPTWQYIIGRSHKKPTWNFWKYLVDHTGHVLGAWGPDTRPEDLYDTIKAAIDNIDPEKARMKITRSEEL
ncbi:unnamed protein product [Lymnaea stagnalis]|uniref:Glutathione peroxidase n=1 Tax=Lymnaea stagnalis TaxID=6523 RepID=A0AAV2H3Y1_LYMST